MTLRVSADGFAEFEIEQALQLCDADLKAVNTKAQPDRVKPSVLTNVQAKSGGLSITLAPASWNVIRATLR